MINTYDQIMNRITELEHRLKLLTPKDFSYYEIHIRLNELKMFVV